MKNYFARRIVTIVPVCFLLTAFAFILTLSIPGDAVDAILLREEGISVSSANYQKQKQKLAHQLGLHKPVFYFSVSSLAEIESNEYFANAVVQSTFCKLVHQTGNHGAVKNYFAALGASADAIRFLVEQKNISSQTNSILSELTTALNQLNSEDNISAIQLKIHTVKNNYKLLNLDKAWVVLNNTVANLNIGNSGWKSFVPAIAFHTDNQFNDWFLGNHVSKGFIRADFGKSYITGKPVLKIISDKIFWSAILSVGSILLAYMLSIPLSVFLVYTKNKFCKSFSEVVLSFLYAIPVYIMGLLLLYLLSNPEVLNIFPSSGIKPTGGYESDASFIDKFFTSLQHLALPIICYTYGTFAFLTRTLTALMRKEAAMDYVRTARAKGMSEIVVIYKHVLRNSTLPLVAVFANIFPSVIGGSVILETMFTIPGMGFETYLAVFNRNYPVIIAVFVFSGLLTIAGYLITDVISSRIDPRIAFNKN